MTPDREHGAVCASPIDAATLMDYWLALMTEAEEAAVEEHLLACDVCGHRLREAIALAESIRTLARSGSLRVIVNDTFAEQRVREGRRVREYSPPRGGSVNCTVAADDDFLLGSLAADLSDARRIDVSFLLNGVEVQRFADIPFRPDAGRIVYQESLTFAKGAPSNSMTARVLAVGEDGGERMLGEYTFVHTRTIPGPPEWQ